MAELFWTWRLPQVTLWESNFSKGAHRNIPDEMAQWGVYQMEFTGLYPKQMFSSWKSSDKSTHPNASNGQSSVRASACVRACTHTHPTLIHRAFYELKIFRLLKYIHHLKIKINFRCLSPPAQHLLDRLGKVGDDFVFNTLSCPSVRKIVPVVWMAQFVSIKAPVSWDSLWD